MKKVVLIVLVAFALLNCEKSKKVVPVSETETSKIITFNKDIKPILSSKCSPCHTAGGDRNNKYEDYNTAKTLLTGIIGRIIRDPSDPLFMPKNGEKLTKTQMDLINKWIEDGLREK
jgi:hypothetical protein